MVALFRILSRHWRTTQVAAITSSSAGQSIGLLLALTKAS